MQHVPILPFVVITLLQLCRAQSSNSTPEWYAANDINDTNFSPKPITELFSTETSFSPEDPIVVLLPSSTLPSNRGIVSSPTPITLYSDSLDNQPPPSVIPLSSTELPPQTIPVSETTQSDTQSQRLSTAPQQTLSTASDFSSGTTQNWTLLSRVPVQFPRNNVVPSVRQNQPPLVPNRVPPQQMLPRNIQFLMPTQTGNRVFQGRQLPSNGQSNVFVLYEQPFQAMRNVAPANLPPPLVSNRISPQPPTSLRDPQQQIVSRPANIVTRPPQMSNSFPPQPNSIPPNTPPPNVIIFPPPNNQQQTDTQFTQPNNNQPSNNPVSNQPPTNQMPDIQQQNNQYQQPTTQMTPPPNKLVTTVIRRRPMRQRNRSNNGRLNNRGPNPIGPNTFPCQRINTTTVPPTATNTPKPVITIRLRPTTISRNSLQINPAQNTNNSTTIRSKPSSQVNSKNYDRCMNSCRDRKDRICAGPEKSTQINPDTLKGFPSMCHMACHNTFRGNPIYEKIANGRCGKLRTRIQTVDKSKIKKDDLKKSQYTIISNIPGTVVELAP